MQRITMLMDMPLSRAQVRWKLRTSPSAIVRFVSLSAVAFLLACHVYIDGDVFGKASGEAKLWGRNPQNTFQRCPEHHYLSLAYLMNRNSSCYDIEIGHCSRLTTLLRAQIITSARFGLGPIRAHQSCQTSHRFSYIPSCWRVGAANYFCEPQLLFSFLSFFNSPLFLHSHSRSLGFPSQHILAVPHKPKN